MQKVDRLQGAIAHLKGMQVIVSNQDIVDKMQINKSSFSLAFNGNEKYLTDRFLKKFNKAFGDIFNIDWLLTGEGAMIKEQEPESNAPSTDIIYTHLIPISAQGGSLNDFEVSVMYSECERIISPIKGADFAITVAGDSMAPEYPSGSQILVKRINEKAFIDWGKTYVLDTCNGTVVKRMVPSEKEGFVRCLSINPSPEYAPFEVSLGDVYGIYRVLMCMSVK